MGESVHTPAIALVTGGAGFIGSYLIRYLLSRYARLRIINIDVLAYAGCVDRLDGLASRWPQRYQFYEVDVCEGRLIGEIIREQSVDTVVHLAAESHVDWSIREPIAVVHTNVDGTCALLEAARSAWGDRRDVRFHHVSTDEVYGSHEGEASSAEGAGYKPRNPYSASKAAADHCVRAWANTFGMNISISISTNNYGPRQWPEKLLPLIVLCCLRERPIPLYGDGSNVRDWLYVGDHCAAIDLIVRQGQPGQTYNVGAGSELRNIEFVQKVCRLMDRLYPRAGGRCYEDLIRFVTDRPGHDRRYAIDCSKIAIELGWKPRHSTCDALAETVSWYVANRDWLYRAEQQLR